MKKFRAPKFNLKYTLGEIILLFVGIDLAIWFNNWKMTIARRPKALTIVADKYGLGLMQSTFGI